MVVERVTREQLFEQVFRGDLPCGANGEMRITRVRVPGREESYVLQEGDSFFLPAGTSYQLVNFEAGPIKAVFGITEL